MLIGRRSNRRVHRLVLSLGLCHQLLEQTEREQRGTGRLEQGASLVALQTEPKGACVPGSSLPFSDLLLVPFILKQGLPMNVPKLDLNSLIHRQVLTLKSSCLSLLCSWNYTASFE